MNNGYGALLTRIEKINDNLLKKKAISEYGKNRITHEINFYKKIISENINFPVPKIQNIDYINYSFELEYLNTYITCQNYLTHDNNNIIIKKIYNDLNILHKNQMIVSKNTFNEDLILETYGKIKNRFNEIREIIDKYKFIKKVNGQKILEFAHIIEFIEKYINNYIKNNNSYTYNLIHGDLQLNNILVDNYDIKYIDPRGFFGKTALYGLKEYDYAKLQFGLGGYSYFDTKIVDELNIIDDNIIIDIKKIKDYEFNELNLTNMFIICIWLGNAHCFKNNEFKMIESYFYAIYVASRFMSNTMKVNNNA